MSDRAATDVDRVCDRSPADLADLRHQGGGRANPVHHGGDREHSHLSLLREMRCRWPSCEHQGGIAGAGDAGRSDNCRGTLMMSDIFEYYAAGAPLPGSWQVLTLVESDGHHERGGHLRGHRVGRGIGGACLLRARGCIRGDLRLGVWSLAA